MPKDSGYRNTSGGKGYGPETSPGMGRGPRSVLYRNPAPEPMRGGFDSPVVQTPDSRKIRAMQKQEFAKRESGRGKGTL